MRLALGFPAIPLAPPGAASPDSSPPAAGYSLDKPAPRCLAPQAYFPPNRLLVMHTSEHFKQPIQSARRVWQWLGLRNPTEAEAVAASQLQPLDELQSVAEKGRDVIPEPTMRAVKAFYFPFNKKLAAMLGDVSFKRGAWGVPA